MSAEAFEAAKVAVDVAQTIVIVVMAGWSFFYRRGTVTQKELDELKLDVARIEVKVGLPITGHPKDEDLTKLANQVARLETKVDQAPTDEDLVSLHKRLDALQQALASLAGESKANHHLLDVIHQHLLDNK